MRALSDALPTGHRAMANPTLQLHFGCGRATPPVSHSHNWPSGRMQKNLFKIGQKKLFFANKDPKTNFDDWMMLQKHVLSFKCNDFFKMANLKAISSSATLRLNKNKRLCSPKTPDRLLWGRDMGVTPYLALTAIYRLSIMRILSNIHCIIPALHNTLQISRQHIASNPACCLHYKFRGCLHASPGYLWQ